MSDSGKAYHLCSDGKHRIKPCHEMIIGGKVYGAGTVVEITNDSDKQEADNVGTTE